MKGKMQGKGSMKKMPPMTGMDMSKDMKKMQHMMPNMPMKKMPKH